MRRSHGSDVGHVWADRKKCIHLYSRCIGYCIVGTVHAMLQSGVMELLPEPTTCTKGQINADHKNMPLARDCSLSNCIACCRLRLGPQSRSPSSPSHSWCWWAGPLASPSAWVSELTSVCSCSTISLCTCRSGLAICTISSLEPTVTQLMPFSIYGVHNTAVHSCVTQLCHTATAYSKQHSLAQRQCCIPLQDLPVCRDSPLHAPPLHCH